MSDAAYRLPLWMTCMVGTLIFSFATTNIIIRYFLTSAQTLQRCGLIVINKGDERNYEAFQKRTKGGPGRAMIIMAALVLQITINIVASVVYDAFR